MGVNDIARAAPQSLRILSYNIQTGIASARYRDYLTQSWRYLVPHRRRFMELGQIADRLSAYDLVALQETDGGSLRTGFINTTEYIAGCASFPHWFDQVNRHVGPLARHGNGLLSRVALSAVSDLKLPGPSGRGALIAQVGPPPASLTIIVAHLALGRRARSRQLAFLSEQIVGHSHLLLLGDLNCEADSTEVQSLCERTGLEVPAGDDLTFPSWRPRRRIDHILASASLHIERTTTRGWRHSDHLPVEARLTLPPALSRHWQARLVDNLQR
jgi:endonuclease/exonuclease/phosphatase family metal-dependent hydrolase